ncbi:hypothetical protein ACHAWF_007361 [Thalassiosira exigua]
MSVEGTPTRDDRASHPPSHCAAAAEHGDAGAALVAAAFASPSASGDSPRRRRRSRPRPRDDRGGGDFGSDAGRGGAREERAAGYGGKEEEEPPLAPDAPPPPGPATLTSEARSFAERASATKFRANYLRHLSGGIPDPRIEAARRRARGGGRGGDGGGDGGEADPADAALRRRGGDGGARADSLRGRGRDGLTDEQRETHEQLRRHLRLHALPRRRPQPRPPAGRDGDREGGGGAGAGEAGPAVRAARAAAAAEAGRGRGAGGGVGGGGGGGGGLRLMGRPQPPGGRAARAAGGGRGPPAGGGGGGGGLPASPAVSTISVSFGPDGRTLASTHGDHTVKITCCHTGALLRSLEGHPRTPWTVKYHPTNPRIVASGCLGFQVRVWDWNFQGEKVRRERRRERERRWGGRYDFDAGGGLGGRRGSGGGGGGGRDATDRVRSPRGVVEHPGSKGGGGARTTGGGGGDDDCDDEAAAERCDLGLGLDPHVAGSLARDRWGDDDDDYAALALLRASVPPDDPAWYDVESDARDTSRGIGVCLAMVRLQSAVISLSFHPSGDLLAMASGSTLHLWDYDEAGRKRREAAAAAEASEARGVGAGGGAGAAGTRESDARVLDRARTSDFPRGRTIDFRHESALRCVHFPPSGDRLVVGGVNPASRNEGLLGTTGRGGDPRRGRGGMSGGGMSFHLRLWDFDLDAALDPGGREGPTMRRGADGGGRPRGGRIDDEGELTWNYPVVKEALCNPRMIIPRVLLYNDGGFDLSRDGKTLAACADFWLPDGVDSAMELVRSQQQLEDEDEERHRLSSANGDGDGTNPTSSPVPGAQGGGGRMSSPSPRGQQLPSFPDPRTPPPNFHMATLEPPSPPGKRNIPCGAGGYGYGHGGRGAPPLHVPHPLSVAAPAHPAYRGGGGRYVPHVVAVSLDDSPPPDGEPLPLEPGVVRSEGMRRHPRLGSLLAAAPLDGTKSSGVTCVKLSPSSEYVLLGYGVRESIPASAAGDGSPDAPRHPVTSVYNAKRGMAHVCTFTCGDDDVNIARFHPESGHGFVYGTKQGRVRVMARRPWNFYQA